MQRGIELQERIGLRLRARLVAATRAQHKCCDHHS
jgi:hypothetical protein